MKFHPPDPTLRFAVFTFDVDADEPEITFHATREAAEAHTLTQWSYADGPSFPDSTEPGGNTYDDDETPNTRIFIVELLGSTVL